MLIVDLDIPSKIRLAIIIIIIIIRLAHHMQGSSCRVFGTDREPAGNGAQLLAQFSFKPEGQGAEGVYCIA